MSLKSKSNLITVLIHILIWVIFGIVLFLYQPLPWNVDIPVQFWIKQWLIFCFLVIAYYLNAKFLVPRFLLENRTALYFTFVIGLIVGLSILFSQMDNFLNIHQLMDAAFHKHGPTRHRERGRDIDIVSLALIALVLGIGTSFTAIQKWQGDIRLRAALEQEKISSELSFLKAQINPHFFFNTLNNIYALTSVNIDTSRKALHQLSRMMRYVLYDTQNATTLLSQEIAFIKDYINLMELRLTEKVTVTFQSPATLKDVPLAPMLFLPFVENAFKHGVSAILASNILISVEQYEESLVLKVENSVFDDQSASLEENKGIGLVNTIRRLDLLYPGKYTLQINEPNVNNIYSVHLTLNLL